MLNFEKVKCGQCLQAVWRGLGECRDSFGGLRDALYSLELSDGAIESLLERWASF